jgi:hypothetical protein
MNKKKALKQTDQFKLNVAPELMAKGLDIEALLRASEGAAGSRPRRRGDAPHIHSFPARGRSGTSGVCHDVGQCELPELPQGHRDRATGSDPFDGSRDIAP